MLNLVWMLPNILSRIWSSRSRQGQFRRQGPADPNSGVRNSSAEFRRQGQFRRQGPANPNSGVRNSSAEFRRQGQFRRQGPADPNSGVRNSSAEFRRQGQFRRQGPADPNSFSHGRQARGGRNSGVKFRRQKHFRRHLSGNRFQASASNSSVGRNLGVSRRPDRNLGVEFERQPNLGVNSSAPNLGAKFELQIRASGGGRNGDPDRRVSVSIYISKHILVHVCVYRHMYLCQHSDRWIDRQTDK